ncbi:MAG TPA: hypothetical protein VHG32_09020, partial [Thermoanaerobaculia bacterium]|nr:hypothetical protein [Thermoanaerobaculia bacterium]
SGRARSAVAPWRILGVATITLEDLRFDRFVEAVLNKVFEADEAADAEQWNAAIARFRSASPLSLDPATVI